MARFGSDMYVVTLPTLQIKIYKFKNTVFCMLHLTREILFYMALHSRIRKMKTSISYSLILRYFLLYLLFYLPFSYFFLFSSFSFLSPLPPPYTTTSSKSTLAFCPPSPSHFLCVNSTNFISRSSGVSSSNFGGSCGSSFSLQEERESCEGEGEAMGRILSMQRQGIPNIVTIHRNSATTLDKSK